MNNEASTPVHCTAILVAAGSGTRMGFDKLLTPIRGRSVLQRSVDRLLECGSIHSMVIVCPPDRWDTLDLPATDKPVTRTDGGTQRQDSVRSGIRSCPPETTHIAIHDAARPLVSADDLNRVMHAAFQTGAATLAHRIVDTLKRADHNQRIHDSVSRDQLWGMETPQAFSRTLLEELLPLTADQDAGFTDEVSLLQSFGQAVLLVESLHPNPKITTPADLSLATALLSLSMDDTPSSVPSLPITR